MFPRTIQRQILVDLVKYTLLALTGISLLLTIVLAMIEAVRRGLDPFVVLSLIPYLLIPTLPYTIPTCLLFACTIVYSGMSGNNEITALKAAGIHAYRIVQPGLILAVVFGFVTVHLVDRVIPSCNTRFREILTTDVETLMFSYLNQNGSISSPDFPYEIYVQSVQGNRLIEPIIKQRSPNGGYEMIVQARSATMTVATKSDGERVIDLQLVEGVAVTDPQNAIHFKDPTISMPIPKLEKPVSERIETLTFRQCLNFSREQRRREAEMDFELANNATAALLTGHPHLTIAPLNEEVRKSAHLRRRGREARAEVHLRTVHAIAGLPFVLLGAPVSILFRRREYLHSFFVCFLPIVVGYYPALILAYNFCKETSGNVFGALWIPPAMLVLISLPLSRQVVRY